METKFLSEEDGGMVKILIAKYKMAIFKCDCNRIIENPNFEGYTHEGGFPDGTGTRWWIYTECPDCKYAWAIKKLDDRVKKLESTNHELGRYELFYREVETIHKTRLLSGQPNIANSVCNLYSIDQTGRRVICTPIVVTDGSHSPMDHVKEMVDRLKPACYVIVLEAWQSSRILEDLPKVKPGDAEKDPDRKEVLWIAGRSKDGNFSKTETWQIVRKKKKIIKFENLDQTVVSSKLP
jgi:hypothetical protein